MLLTQAIVFIIILGVLILVHELGHFVSAKLLKIKVEEFGFGLPPRAWGRKIGETTYSLNWLPIGGFVKLYGEDEAEIDKKQRRKKNKVGRAFFARPVWQRAVVLTAGVSMNFVLGVLVMSYLFTTGVMVPTTRVHIEKVLPDTPAFEADLKEGDIIKEVRIMSQEAGVKDEKLKSGKDTSEVAGQSASVGRDFKEAEVIEIKKGEDLTSITKEHLGEEIELLILRAEGDTEKEVAARIIPRKEYPNDQGPMGIVISHFEEVRYSLLQAPVEGTRHAFVLSWELVKGIGATLWKLVTFQQVSKDIAGPVGIAQITGEAVRFGRNAVLELLGLLSLNLAIVNILPFPALDGGRLLFVAVEAATGRKIKARWEQYVHQVGMAILLALLALITINDLVRVFL